MAGLALGFSPQAAAVDKFVVIDSALNTYSFTIKKITSDYGLNNELMRSALRIPDVSSVDENLIDSSSLSRDLLSPYTLSFSTLQNNYRQATSGLWYLTKSILPLTAKGYNSLIGDARYQTYFANQRLDALKTYQQQKSLTLNSQREGLLRGLLQRLLPDGNTLGSTPYFNAYNDVSTTVFKARKELAAGATGLPLTQQQQDELSWSLNFKVANQKLLAGLGVTSPSTSTGDNSADTTLTPRQVRQNLSQLGLNANLISRYLQASPKVELVSTAYLATTDKAPTAEQIPTREQVEQTHRFIHESKNLAYILENQYDKLVSKVNLDAINSEAAKDLVLKQVTETKQLHADFVAAANAYTTTLRRVLGSSYTFYDVVEGYADNDVSKLKKRLTNWSDYLAILEPSRREYSTNTQLFFAYRDGGSYERATYDQTRLYLESSWIKNQLTQNLQPLVTHTSFRETNSRFPTETTTLARPDFAQAQAEARNNPTNYWALLNGNLHRQLVRFDNKQSLPTVGFTSYKAPFHADAWINLARARDTQMLQSGIDAAGYSVSLPPQCAELTHPADFFNLL